MLKDILVNLPIGPRTEAIANYAVSVAAEFKAHLAGIAFAYEPVIPGSVFAGVTASLVASYRAESTQAAAAARHKFQDVARLASLPLEAKIVMASAEGAGEIFSRLARNHDLAIIGQAEPTSEAPAEALIEAALFGSGRPVLVVPYIQDSPLKLDRVMVCWDGSRNAARAVGDAMPFLERAQAVEVVTIEGHERKGEIVGADIARNLARHARNVELKPIVARDTDIASTILSHAADSSADLIVMGGYGHSRLREFVLGGATRGMLGAMTVPTLMSH
jgi:nucleotide-binding universal stress UspA family protein